jgi:hypothetical protein
MNVEAIAIIAAVLFGVIAVIQIALALGAPAGQYVFGGGVAQDDGRLPSSYRIFSGIAAVLVIAFAWVILARAGVIESSMDERFLTIASWAIVAYMAINTAANLLSGTKFERYFFGSVSAILVILCAIVAAAGPT